MGKDISSIGQVEFLWGIAIKETEHGRELRNSLEVISLDPPSPKRDTTASPFIKGRLRGISRESLEGFREAQPPYLFSPPLLCSDEGEGETGGEVAKVNYTVQKHRKPARYRWTRLMASNLATATGGSWSGPRAPSPRSG